MSGQETSSLPEQPQLPLGVASCGYCGNPMPGKSCIPCAPELARISTMSQWQEFMTRKARDLRRRTR